MFLPIVSQPWRSRNCEPPHPKSINDQLTYPIPIFAPGRQIQRPPLPTCTEFTHLASTSTDGCSTVGNWPGRKSASPDVGRCGGIHTSRARCESPAPRRAKSAWCDPSSTGGRQIRPAALCPPDHRGLSKGSRSQIEAQGRWSSMRTARSYRSERKPAAASRIGEELPDSGWGGRSNPGRRPRMEI